MCIFQPIAQTRPQHPERRASFIEFCTDKRYRFIRDRAYLTILSAMKELVSNDAVARRKYAG
jgi:hypothetical protein